MSTFGPLGLTEVIEVQAICAGPGGLIYAPPVFYSPDCGPICDTGPPQSSNGAASQHAWWATADTPFCELSVDFAVESSPAVSALYFWALSVDFVEAGIGIIGGGHTGLQYFPAYPGNGAVNWGGYSNATGNELPGGPLTNPSAVGNVNTMNYSWVAGRTYRYRIFESPVLNVPKAWRATITDLTTGVETVIRDLYGGGDWMASPAVWTESFADCDAPPVCSQFTNLQGVDCETSEPVTPSAYLLTYQSCADGGCSNTDTSPAVGGVRQCTNTTRTFPHGVEVAPLV